MWLLKTLYTWVLIAIVAGGLLGYFNPDAGVALKPVSDAFISLIKMLIGPVVFCTVVLGIAGSGGLKKFGRIGGKALLYFEVISTLALVLGLLAGNIFKPGKGFNVEAKLLENSTIFEYANKAREANFIGYILHIIPKTFVDAFTGGGDLLQILFLAVLFGVALARLQNKNETIINFIRALSEVLFIIVNMVMKLAPLGAGAAMAFTIGKFGLDALKPLLAFMALFYSVCLIFIFVVLGLLARAVKLDIIKFLAYIKVELLTVLGTSSSESVLVPLMEKLEALGCSKSVVGLVIPAGYSFNLDGTNIYLSLAVLFVSQAMGVDLSLQQQFGILLVAMLTSKGASGVTGSGFITLAATLAVVPTVPVAGLALILGIDRFMSEARALTNIIGNGVAAVVISKWENELDENKMHLKLGTQKQVKA